MQKSKSISAAFLLLLVLTLFFTALPLCAVNENTTNGNTNAPAADQGPVEDGVLEEAADGARDMVGDDQVGNDQVGNDLAGDQAETTIPGQTTTPGITKPGTVPDDTAPDTDPGASAGDGHTLGDTNGDGVTTDSVVEGGVPWGWILLGLLAAAVVVVLIALCVPRRG